MTLIKQCLLAPHFVYKWVLKEYLGSGRPLLSAPSPGNLPLLGQCLTSYWEQKKLMAPGCEPLAVRRMMDVLAPHVHGQSLAGAGGGGFLYLLTKEPRQKEALEAVLAKTEVPNGVGGVVIGGGQEPSLWPTTNQGLQLQVPLTT